MSNRTGWLEAPDAEHPIRRSGAGGDEPDAYLTVEDAANRMANFGLGARSDLAAGLLAGRKYRTDFAFYELSPEATGMSRPHVPGTDYYDGRDGSIEDDEPCDECAGTRWPTERHEEHCSLYVAPRPK